MSPFWRLEFGRGCPIFVKLGVPWCRLLFRYSLRNRFIEGQQYLENLIFLVRKVTLQSPLTHHIFSLSFFFFFGKKSSIFSRCKTSPCTLPLLNVRMPLPVAGSLCMPTPPNGDNDYDDNDCGDGDQGCTNHGRQVARAATFCTVVANIYEFSTWNLLMTRVWLLQFWVDLRFRRIPSPLVMMRVVYVVVMCISVMVMVVLTGYGGNVAHNWLSWSQWFCWLLCQCMSIQVT